VWVDVEGVAKFARSDFGLLSRTVQRNMWQVLCSNLGQERAILTKVIRDFPQSLQ
jgi:hypothetical protein